MPVIGFAAKWLLRVATGASIWGVYEFETNDIGKSDISGPRLKILIVRLK
jgi:succinate dehydrogenase (ubiquinone) membrane anchor subunit